MSILFKFNLEFSKKKSGLKEKRKFASTKFWLSNFRVKGKSFWYENSFGKWVYSQWILSVTRPVLLISTKKYLREHKQELKYYFLFFILLELKALEWPTKFRSSLREAAAKDMESQSLPAEEIPKEWTQQFVLSFEWEFI